MNFEEYLKEVLANDKNLHKEYDALELEYELIKGLNKQNCHSCFYRHRLCRHPLPEDYKKCKHWRLGKCFTCKYGDADDDEWFKRGCEAHCFGGCRNYKRDWKKTFEYIKIKFKR